MHDTLCFAGQKVSWKMDGEACPADGRGTCSVRVGSWSDWLRSGTDCSGVIFITSTFKNWGKSRTKASFSHLQGSNFEGSHLYVDLELNDLMTHTDTYSALTTFSSCIWYTDIHIYIYLYIYIYIHTYINTVYCICLAIYDADHSAAVLQLCTQPQLRWHIYDLCNVMMCEVKWSEVKWSNVM